MLKGLQQFSDWVASSTGFRSASFHCISKLAEAQSSMHSLVHYTHFKPAKRIACVQPFQSGLTTNAETSSSTCSPQVVVWLYTMSLDSTQVAALIVANANILSVVVTSAPMAQHKPHLTGCWWSDFTAPLSGTSLAGRCQSFVSLCKLDIKVICMGRESKAVILLAGCTSQSLHLLVVKQVPGCPFVSPGVDSEEGVRSANGKQEPECRLLC